jgi:diguanylate cyclase (GGDEF)-like protein
MTPARASERAIVATLVVLGIGAAFLRVSSLREREAELAAARQIGTGLQHRLETEFARLAALSEAVTLTASDRTCESSRAMFAQLMAGHPAIRSIRLSKRGATCESPKPADASGPAEPTAAWVAENDHGGDTTIVRGPFSSPGGGQWVHVEHRDAPCASEAACEGRSSTLVIDLLRVLGDDGIDLLGAAGYQFALFAGQGDKSEPPFLGVADLPPGRTIVTLNLPGATWTLAMARADAWRSYGFFAAALALVAAFAAAAGFSTYGLLRQPELLRAEVERRRERLSRVREDLDHEASERQRAEQRLELEQTTDPLTGLHNRRTFHKRVDAALTEARARPGCEVAVLVLDLDGFSRLNNALGHEIGDECLGEVARRLRATLREEHAVARLGPDDFGLLVFDCKSVDIVRRFAGRLQEGLRAPFTARGEEVALTASIGIAVSDVDGQTAEACVGNAEIAMGQARGQGGACHVLFERAMHSVAISEVRLEKELRAGIPRGELFSVFQPIVDLATLKVTGFESLIRWRHPQRGVVAPAEFLPIAERTGLILDIDRWCMADSMRQLATWHARFPSEPPLTMNVNLSGKEFNQDDLVEVVDSLIRKAGVDPASISLEVTETVMMENPERARSILTGLKKLGVLLAIDDFGTGYSSLSYLHQMPLDTVKVDRSFVWNMSASAKNLEIVQAVIRLAGRLGMKVVAEGIETSEQLTQLKSLGCLVGQGFLFSRPLESAGAEALLRDGLGAAAAADAGADASADSSRPATREEPALRVSAGSAGGST